MLEYRHGFEKIEDLDFQKGNGLIPAIVQNAQDGQVLMLGYMNQEALEKTLETKLVTFYSRDRQKLWTKGEESGNFLHLRGVTTDCDKDSLLILARPDGPTWRPTKLRVTSAVRAPTKIFLGISNNLK